MIIMITINHLEKTFGKGDSQSTREKDVAPTRTNLMVMMMLIMMYVLKVMLTNANQLLMTMKTKEMIMMTIITFLSGAP